MSNIAMVMAAVFLCYHFLSLSSCGTGTDPHGQTPSWVKPTIVGILLKPLGCILMTPDFIDFGVKEERGKEGCNTVRVISLVIAGACVPSVKSAGETGPLATG